MRVQSIVVWGADRFGDRLANVMYIELAFEQAEHPIRGEKPAHARHPPHFERLVEKPPGRTVERGAENSDDMPAEALEVRQVCIRLGHASPAEENHIALVACDKELFGNIGTSGNETHAATVHEEPCFVHAARMGCAPTEQGEVERRFQDFAPRFMDVATVGQNLYFV